MHLTEKKMVSEQAWDEDFHVLSKYNYDQIQVVTCNGYKSYGIAGLL